MLVKQCGQPAIGIRVSPAWSKLVSDSLLALAHDPERDHGLTRHRHGSCGAEGGRAGPDRVNSGRVVQAVLAQPGLEAVGAGFEP